MSDHNPETCPLCKASRREKALEKQEAQRCDDMTKTKRKPQTPVRSTRLVRMRRDRDVLALERCCKALDRSTSPRMLKANLAFLVDRYITHPNK